MPTKKDKRHELSPDDPILPPTLSPAMEAVQRAARAIDKRMLGTEHHSSNGQSPVSYHAPLPTEDRSSDGQSPLSYCAPPTAGLVRHIACEIVPKVSDKI